MLSLSKMKFISLVRRTSSCSLNSVFNTLLTLQNKEKSLKKCCFSIDIFLKSKEGNMFAISSFLSFVFRIICIKVSLAINSWKLTQKSQSQAKFHFMENTYTIYAAYTILNTCTCQEFILEQKKIINYF